MSAKNISAKSLKKLIDSQNVTVIDVRTLTEFEEGHIWKSVHLPIDTLPESASELPKDSVLVTVCNKGGGRSERAAGILVSAGWSNTCWLEGGYLGWMDLGFPEYEPGSVSS